MHSEIKALKQVTAPSAEPVTLTEVKAQLRITHSDEDTLLNALITAAREHTEHYLARALVSQTWDCWLDDFPHDDEDMIELPRPPLISVTHVKYYDDDDTEQTWDSANYVVNTDDMIGKVYPAREKVYPTVRDFPRSVNIRYVAGYADSGASPADLADNVPEPIKSAIKMLIGHWFENRELSTPSIEVNELPYGYVALLAPYKQVDII